MFSASSWISNPKWSVPLSSQEQQAFNVLNHPHITSFFNECTIHVPPMQCSLKQAWGTLVSTIWIIHINVLLTIIVNARNADALSPVRKCLSPMSGFARQQFKQKRSSNLPHACLFRKMQNGLNLLLCEWGYRVVHLASERALWVTKVAKSKTRDAPCETSHRWWCTTSQVSNLWWRSAHH